jgi:sortase (surface protein transpeptidase)
MAIIGLILTGLALLASLVFNGLQYQWRQQDQEERRKENAERERKENQRLAQQVEKEEAPPQVYNQGGNRGPLSILSGQVKTGHMWSRQNRP